jgi:hypothetical protein
VARIRVLRTAKATLSRTFYLDEVGTDPTGSVGVSVNRLNGTLVESGTATATGNPGEVTYTFGGLDVVDELVLTWSASMGGDAVVLDSDRIEVVGGFYFGLAEGRDVDKVLKDPVKFPSATLADVRAETEDECERITGQAWVPRFRRETLSGSGSSVLQLSNPLVRAVRSVTVAGIAWSVPAWSELGLLHYPSGWPAGHLNVVVEYEHGHDTPNTEIVRASKQRFKSIALEGKSALPDRAERVITVDQQGGSVVYGSPTADKTGIPGVDAVYHRYPPPQPGFG